MYCPACSAPANNNQKFCRSCGLSLDGLAERIAAQQGTTPATRSEFTTLVIAAGKWMSFGGLGLLLVTLLLAFLSVAFGLFSKGAIEFYTMKSLAIALTLMVLGGGTLCLPSLLQRERKSPSLPTPALTSSSITTVELEQTPLLANVASVTEATTRNLEPVWQEGTRSTPASEPPHQN